MSIETAHFAESLSGKGRFFVQYPPNATTQSNVRSKLATVGNVSVSNLDSDSATVDASTSSIRSIAKLPFVSSVTAVQPAIPSGFKGPADYINSDQTFNADGVYASGVPIGVSPVFLENSCVYNTDHVSFQHATFKYKHVTRCDSDADCDFSCDADNTNKRADCETINFPSRVVNLDNTKNSVDVCMYSKDSSADFESPHGYHVASRIAQDANAGSDKRHASSATIYIPNVWPTTTTSGGKPDNYQEQLNWFAAEGVRLLVKSWTLDNDSQNHGPFSDLTDQYAKGENLTIVSSAGNQTGWVTLDTHQDGDVDKLDERVTYHSQNSIGVGASARKSSYDDLTDDVMWNGSKWGNPKPDGMSSPYEITAPEVTSEGKNARVAASWNTTDFRRLNGTSFAAPTVAGTLGLLFKDRGGGVSDPLLPIASRGCVRLSSRIPQNLNQNRPAGDPIYPTVPPVATADRDSDEHKTDLYGGSGLLEAGQLRWLCDNDPETGGGDGTGGNTTIRTNVEWESIEPFQASTDIEVVNGNNLRTSEEGLNVDEYDRGTLWELGEIPKGTKLRTVITWNSCADGIRFDAESDIDYDLLVCDYGAKCLAGSLSMHDMTEGVEMKFKSHAEDVRIDIIKKEGDTGCEGTDTVPFFTGWVTY